MSKVIVLRCDHPECNETFETNEEPYAHFAWQAGWDCVAESMQEDEEIWFCPEHIPENLEERNEQFEQSLESDRLAEK